MNIIELLENKAGLPYKITLVQGDIETESGDDGIGGYEYWGFVGYDSNPYILATNESTLTVEIDGQTISIDCCFEYNSGESVDESILWNGEKIEDYESIESPLMGEIQDEIESLRSEVRRASERKDPDYD